MDDEILMENNNATWVLIGTVLTILLLLPVFFAFIINVLVPFKDTRDFIKMEMERSTGKKQRYWKRELKKLYISHIPVVRWFFRKKYW